MIDTNREPAREWISSRNALEHLHSVGLTPADNPKRLAQWAAAGLLPARALFLRERGARLPAGSLVPTWVWETVLEGLWVKVLDWQAGSLKVLRYNLGPILDVEAHGVEFDKIALLKLAPAPAQQDPLGLRAPGRRIGRPSATGQFSAADEVIMARMQELIDEGYPSPTAAARKLWDDKQLEGHSEEAAIRRVARKFRKRG